MRTSFLVFLTFLISAAGYNCSYAENPINFLVVSDLGDFGGGDQMAVAESLGEIAGEINPTAILNLGDTFHYWGVESVDDPAWQQGFESVYTAPALHNMWYSALGNHDYQGNTQAVIDYSARCRRWNTPSHYFTKSFRRGPVTVDVIFLDTTPFLSRAHSNPDMYPDAQAQDTAAQTRWLAAQLAASKADWVIVAAHHPIYSSRPDGARQRADVRAHIEPVLATRRPDLYLAGDVHCFEHFQSPDSITDYITCTSGSNAYPAEKVPGELFASGASGFASMAVYKDHIDITLYDKDGREIYNFEKVKRP